MIQYRVVAEGEVVRHPVHGLVTVMAVGPDDRAAISLSDGRASVLTNAGRIVTVETADLHHGRMVWVDDD